VDCFLVHDSAAGEVSRRNSSERQDMGAKSHDSPDLVSTSEGQQRQKDSSSHHQAGEAAARAGRSRDPTEERQVSSKLVFGEAGVRNAAASSGSSASAVYGKYPVALGLVNTHVQIIGMTELDDPCYCWRLVSPQGSANWCFEALFFLLIRGHCGGRRIGFSR